MSVLNAWCIGAIIAVYTEAMACSNASFHSNIFCTAKARVIQSSNIQTGVNLTVFCFKCVLPNLRLNTCVVVLQGIKPG